MDGIATRRDVQMWALILCAATAPNGSVWPFVFAMAALATAWWPASRKDRP